MKILIEIKNVYGRECIYPACPVAALLCKLTGKKTFDRENDLPIIRGLGYEIEIKTPAL